MSARRGFTLIELLIVIALVAILATLAGPAFRSFIQNTRATAQANELVAALNLARSEAAKRGVTVELCAAANQSSCSDDHSDWTNNWLVVDTDSNEVIRVWNSMADGMKLKETPGNQARVEFNARGASTDGETYDFELWFEGCTGDQTRDIEINAAGRPSVTRTDDQCS